MKQTLYRRMLTNPTRGEPTRGEQRRMIQGGPGVRANQSAACPLVLIGTPSQYRKAWYLDELGARGFHVVVSTTGEWLLDALTKLSPDAMVVETSSRWDCARWALKTRESVPELRSLPTILIACDGVRSDAYELAQYSIQGYFGRFPDADDLTTSLTCVMALLNTQPSAGGSA